MVSGLSGLGHRMFVLRTRPYKVQQSIGTLLPPDRTRKYLSVRKIETVYKRLLAWWCRRVKYPNLDDINNGKTWHTPESLPGGYVNQSCTSIRILPLLVLSLQSQGPVNPIAVG